MRQGTEDVVRGRACEGGAVLGVRVGKEAARRRMEMDVFLVCQAAEMVCEIINGFILSGA